MDSSEILMDAKTSSEVPHGWIVLPLLRSKVILGIIGWILGILLGLGLFTGLALIDIPYHYQHDFGFLAGRGFTQSCMPWRRRRMRTPTTLAFVDSRTETEVTVVTDGSYGDPFMIAALLKQYAASVQNIA